VKARNLAVAFVFSAVASVVSGCHTPSKPSQAASAESKPATSDGTEVVLPLSEQKDVIAVAKAEQSDQLEVLHFPGKIALPDNETWHVGVLSSGRVERVYANLGDYVKKGTIIARMHSHDVHEARASYAMAKSEETRATAAGSLAQVTFDRMQRLYALKAASVEQVEQARQELVNSNSALKNAKTEVLRNRVHLEENLGIPADAPMEGGKADNELIPIVAPADGYILQKNVTPGTTITSGSDVFVIGDLKHLWMLASVGQESLAKINIGQHAEVSLPGIPGETFSGTVTNLGQAFDPTTRRLQIRIQLDTSSTILHPEMLANADIAAGTKHPVILVDPGAVQQLNGQDAVFVRTAPDRFEVRPVRTSDSIHGKTVIAEGLRPGENVVTCGGFLLKSQMLRAAMQGE
jgi:cobalt-zinc-cadmium efflux system membrane fusion protein